MAIGTETGPPQRLLDERAALYQSRFSVNISQILSGRAGGEAQPAINKVKLANKTKHSIFENRAGIFPKLKARPKLKISTLF